MKKKWRVRILQGLFLAVAIFLTVHFSVFWWTSRDDRSGWIYPDGDFFISEGEKVEVKTYDLDEDGEWDTAVKKTYSTSLKYPKKHRLSQIDILSAYTRRGTYFSPNDDRRTEDIWIDADRNGSYDKRQLIEINKEGHIVKSSGWEDWPLRF